MCIRCLHQCYAAVIESQIVHFDLKIIQFSLDTSRLVITPVWGLARLDNFSRAGFRVFQASRKCAMVNGMSSKAVAERKVLLLALKRNGCRPGRPKSESDLAMERARASDSIMGTFMVT